MMGPISDALVAELAVREGAAFACWILWIDGSITARFSVLAMVPVPC